jgi:hypothetical protein
MKNSKFLSLFRTLNKKEAKCFNKYLTKHYPGDAIAHTVFHYLHRLHPDFKNDRNLDTGYAYQKIFKEPLDAHPHNRTRLLNTLSDLHLWLKEFLMQEKTKMESFETRTLWVGILKERGLKAEYGRQSEKLLKDLTNNPVSNIQDYMWGMFSSYFYYYHLVHDKLSGDFSALENCANNMDVFYAVSRLKIACEMANRRNQLSLEYPLETLPMFLELSGTKHLSRHLLLGLYGSVYDLIANREAQRFTEIESLLNAYHQTLVADELHTILSYLYNFASFRIRHGDESYWHMTHRLNQFGVRNEIFLNSGAMSPSQYNNIVTAACKAKDFDWAHSFITTHRHLLLKDLQTNTVLLSEAIIAFENGKFAQTINTLSKVTFTDLHNTIRIKSLALRCHYEIAEPDFIENFCFSFEGYLRRHRKPKQEAVEATLNFSHIVKKLILERTQKGKLMEEIERTKPLYFKPWLLEKAAVYKGRYAARR